MGERITIRELKLNEVVTSFYLVRNPQLRLKKTGGPFLTLLFADRTGEIPAVMWEDVEGVGEQIREGDIVKVQGIVGSYQGELQLTVQRLRLARDDEVTLEELLPATDADVEELLAYLQQVTASLKTEPLRELLIRIFAQEGFRKAFAQAPAAKELHHAFLGGLLEHTVSVVKICETVAHHYGEVVDRDLLLASAILHDVGKISELTWGRSFDYSDEGRLLGHITQGVLFVEGHIREIPDFPPSLRMELLHNIISHHGEYEWGSPRRPMTLEAMILHFVENLDGKVHLFLKLIKGHPDPQHQGWTLFHRSLDRPLFFGRERGVGDEGGAGEGEAIDF